MKPFLIGLAGYSGAGKSTIAQHLEMQGGVKAFPIDNFYKDEHQAPLVDGVTHWDLPESLHLDQIVRALRLLKSGEEVETPLYDKKTNQAVGRKWFQPAPIIFAEGLQLFSNPQLRDLLDVKIWIDVSKEVALERKIHREPDYDLEYYQKIALPAIEKFVDPVKVYADELLSGMGSIHEVTSEADRIIHRRLGV